MGLIQKCWIRIPTHMSRTVTHSKTRMRTSCEGAGYAESLSGASKDAERQLCGKVPEARVELARGCPRRILGPTALLKVYGVSAPSEETGDNRAHGRDERVGVKS